MKRVNRVFGFIISISMMLLLAACGNTAVTTPSVSEPQPPAVKESTEPAPEPTVADVSCLPTADNPSSVSQLSGNSFYPWIVYWDNETAITESSSLASVMTSISVFAAYFKDDDSIIFPQSSQDTLQAVSDAYGTSVETYLTFVNDIKYDNGDSSLKDVDLLRRLFSSQTRMDAHIGEIVALAKAKGVSGIEIDYENIKGDDALWQLFAQFLTALNNRVSSEGLKLRVVLETSALEKTAFPVGPQYTVMVYNLYGSHSDEPGPKADNAFIAETAAKSVCLGPEVCFAFATGGFDWPASGDIAQLCETAAAELAKTTQSVPERDPGSGALHYTYHTDTSHTVWYADGETLCDWMQAAKAAGIKNFALWRLGGNSDGSLRMVSDYIAGK